MAAGRLTSRQPSGYHERFADVQPFLAPRRAMSSRKAASGSRSAATAPVEGPERLQKIMAAAGLGSRRHCEELILAGRVEVDGQVASELGTKADPRHQQIRVDGVPIAQPRRVYFMVHKPPGVVSTNRDPSGRPRVIDLVPYPQRLFTVGRLDLWSEGLILATNDGELANRLAHPRYGVEKTYQVEVAGTVSPAELKKLRGGMHLAEGVVRVVTARVKQRFKRSTLLEIVLAEGRNREIRRILARAGHKVLRLKRVALGPLRLAELPPGAVRPLARQEVRDLKLIAGGGERQRPRRAKRPVSKAKTASSPPRRTVITGDGPNAGVARSGRRKTATRRPRRTRVGKA